jgi:hypothetical protein
MIRPGITTTSLMIAVLLLAAECAPVVKRDLSQVPPGRVGYDDLCGLQDYFDDLSTKSAMPPTIVTATEIEKVRADSPLAGRSRFAFESDYQLAAVRRVLRDNWRRLPEGVETAPRIELEVEWSARSGLRRVVTNRDADLILGPVRSPLPYQVCLSELLFGEPLYRRRRDVLALAPLSPNQFNRPESALPSGGPDGGSGASSTALPTDGGTRRGDGPPGSY